jgi:hypothetical protein
LSYFWNARISHREMAELKAWWEERKKKAWIEGRTPIKWQPRGKLERKTISRETFDRRMKQRYTDGITSLSSESPLIPPDQGVLTFNDKD